MCLRPHWPYLDCHDPSLHFGHDRHSRTIDNPQTIPDPDKLQEKINSSNNKLKSYLNPSNRNTRLIGCGKYLIEIFIINNSKESKY